MSATTSVAEQTIALGMSSVLTVTQRFAGVKPLMDFVLTVTTPAESANTAMIGSLLKTQSMSKINTSAVRPAETNGRKKMQPYEKLLELCKNGALEPMDVLENIIINWMSTDEANEFAEQEYDIEKEDK